MEIGNGEKIQFGTYPCLGWKNHQIISPQLLHTLHLQGIIHLNQVVDPASSSLWQQGWKSAKMLGIPDGQANDWNAFL